MKSVIKYCAVYTRKSSEEGLEQGFNSLDAQREACLAYITSQKAEGWVAVKEEYSDGGFSGGNMERPALKRLMADIKAGKVHIIVVYKIDRLTRSLMDFAKLVEVFDAHGVTFVSVTQSFNTTTSMGRLTLNVLLSFAQFEREVAGERIRDKIAASKKKGMWMGGSVPLGYDVKDRLLMINAHEAERVQYIFQKYLELGCVQKTKEHLDAAGIRSKAGHSFSRGVLYWMLQNPLYLGQTRHKGEVYKGQHQSIIAAETYDSVQQKLGLQGVRPRGDIRPAQNHLLQGLLYDEEGTIYSPVFSTKKGRRYRYYVSRNKLLYRNHPKAVIARIPAHEIETFIEQRIRERLADSVQLANMLGIPHDQYYDLLRLISIKCECLPIDKILERCVRKVLMGIDTVNILINMSGLAKLIEEDLGFALPVAAVNETAEIAVPYQARKSWRGTVVLKDSRNASDPLELPSHELRDLLRGVVWRDQHFNGLTMRQIAERDGHSEVFVGRLIHKTFEIA
ncbi:MAG: recombinase family protein [bacterium]|nr:recombinase family protein [bacterium]